MSTEAPFLRVEGLAKRFPGAAEPVFDSVNFGIDVEYMVATAVLVAAIVRRRDH